MQFKSFNISSRLLTHYFSDKLLIVINLECQEWVQGLAQGLKHMCITVHCAVEPEGELKNRSVKLQYNMILPIKDGQRDSIFSP